LQGSIKLINDDDGRRIVPSSSDQHGKLIRSSMKTVARFLLLGIWLFAEIATAAPATLGNAKSRPVAKVGHAVETIPVVDFFQGRLSVKIVGAPLATVLKVIAARTGARIILLGGSDQTVGADFTNQPLEEGLRRLLRGRNLALFYTANLGARETGYLVSEIKIFPLLDDTSTQTTIFYHDVRLMPRSPAKTLLGEQKVNPEIERLAKQLAEAKDSQTRRKAAAALAKLADPSAIGPLSEALLTDADASVRATAAEALGKTWDEGAVAPLARMLSDDASSSVREAAARALGVTWSDDAVSPLIEAMLSDRDALVREQAARGLAQIAGEEAVEALAQTLSRDPRVFVRDAAAMALGSIGGQDALDALAKASMADGDEWVRETAAVAAVNSPK
jgi:hypothetical protein